MQYPGAVPQKHGMSPARWEAPDIKPVLQHEPHDHDPVIARVYFRAAAPVLPRPAKRFAFPAQHEPPGLLSPSVLFKSQPLPVMRPRRRCGSIQRKSRSLHGSLLTWFR